MSSPDITKIYNDSKDESNFPESLKMANISPVYKKDETSNKITIDLSAYFPPFLNVLKEPWTIKYTYTWVNIYRNFYVAFEKVKVRNTA